MTQPAINRALSLFLRFGKASTDFTVRVLYKVLWHKFDILIRLALAQAFFAPGAMKVTHWSACIFRSTCAVVGHAQMQDGVFGRHL